MAKLQCDIPDELKRRLKVIAAVNSNTISQVTAQALEEYISKRETV